MSHGCRVTPGKPPKPGDIIRIGGLFGSLHYVTEDGSLAPVLGGVVDIGPGKMAKLTLSQIKNIGKYKSLIGEHLNKLINYKANHLKYDHLGKLKNASSSETYSRIYNSYVKHLRHEIRAFRKNINEIINGR